MSTDTLPTEQEYLDRWAAATFEWRPALGALAAIAALRSAGMFEDIIAGERKEAIHQMGLLVIVLYRIASAYEVVALGCREPRNQRTHRQRGPTP